MLSESSSREEEHREYLRDEDSLFGSPPPSPAARGRSPSPTLALPSTLSAAFQAPSPSSVAQNVGNIALTRSQTNSEKSINPLALSLSLPGGSFTPVLPQLLPSSLSTQSQRQVSREPSDTSRPSSSSSRASPTSVTRRKAAQTRKRARKPQSKDSTPQTPTTDISLPDPSQPLPPRFLRNQQGLLGHAGLIAGVKPAKLATMLGNPRGSSPSNPIVLDENAAEAPALLVTPMIGRSHVKHMESLDLTKLPTPTNQEIVEMLIKQKDIFPVLENLLKLSSFAASNSRTVSSSAQAIGTGTRSATPVFSATPPRSSSQPPVKKRRRKLGDVPAGAADWDVPYPFAEGEGPEAYKKNWVKQRRKQLIQQLVGLIKVATRKAAAKKYVVEMEKARRRELQGNERVNEEWATKQKINHSIIDRELEREKETVTGGEEVHQDTSNERAHSCSDFYRPGTTAPDSVSQASSGNDSGHAAISKEPLMHGASLFGNVIPDEVGSADFTTSFDQLISSLLTTPSEFRYATKTPPPSSSNQAVSSDQLSPFDLTSTGGNIDQALVDHWVDFLQSFPPVDGFGTDSWTSPNCEPSDRESFFGNLPFAGNLSTFASPLSSDISSFATTPILDAQQFQSFPGLEQLGLDGRTDGDMLIGSQPQMGMTENFEDNTVSKGEISMDFSSNMSLTSEGKSEVLSDTTFIPQSSFMEVDRINPSVDLAAIGQSIPYLHYQQPNEPIASLTTSLSPPDASTLAVSELSMHALATPVPPDGSGNDQVPFSPSIIPSPMSLADPATPSSAGWDMSIPEVAGEERDREQGLNPGNFDKGVARILEKNTEINDGSIIEDGKEASVMATNAQDNGGPANRPALVEVSTNPPSSFQILRLDVESESTTKTQHPKLTKSDVLRRAEEKKNRLKSDLEEVKMKLWESTIEHGALLHLMRICGEAEKSNAS